MIPRGLVLSHPLPLSLLIDTAVLSRLMVERRVWSYGV